MPLEPRDPRISGPIVLSALARRWPRAVLLVQVLLAVLAGAFLGHAPSRGLEDLMSADTASDLRVLRSEFPSPDDLLLFVRGSRPQARELFIEDLEGQLARQPALFPDRLFKLDLSQIEQRLLFYLSAPQLRELASLMDKLRPRLTSGGSLLDWTRSSGKPTGLLAFYLHQLQVSLHSRGREAWKSPLDQMVGPEQAKLLRPFWEGRNYRYMQMQDDTHLMLVRPADDLAVDRLRVLLRETAVRNPEVDVELTGNQAIIREQRGAVVREFAPAGAFIGGFLGLSMLVGMVAPRPLGASILATMLGMSVSAGLGAWLLDLGPIWLTAQALVATLFGYLALHYAVDRDLRHAFRVSVIGGSGFALMGFLPLGPPANLGWACAAGTIVCSLALLTLIPALDQLGWIPPDPGLAHWLEKSWPGRRPTRAILGVTSLLAVSCLGLVGRARFTADPIAALDTHAPSLRTELELKGQGTSSLFALVLAPNLARANAYCQVIRSMPRVKETFSLAQFLPPGPDPERSRSVVRIVEVARAARLPKPIPLKTAADLQALARAVPASNSPSSLVAEMGPGGIQDALQSFQRHLLQDLERMLRLLSSQRTDPLQLKDLPGGIQERLVGQSGSVAVMVFPKLGQGDTLEDFVADMRRVTSLVGGPAVLAADIASLTRQSLRMVPWALGLGMLLGLALVYRSLRAALLVLLGPSLALVFSQACLAFYHIPLNFLTWPAPSMVLLLGVSISLGTLRRPRASLKALFPAFSILVISLSMLWSAHPGLAGLGLVMALGMGFNLLVSVVVLPSAQAFLRTIHGHPG
ncbi:MMPL family transporter [bacterium]|nr:MMPL family transporter [bacterium]